MSATTHSFQTEVKTLLHLMVHSLYSDREIFLRELISNAADAADKLRFEALGNDALLEGDSELWARVSADEKAGTLTIADNGLGMTMDEAVTQLGTIAKSGTAEFLQKLSGDKRKDSQLIGQFGVGFYSAFMVADRLEVKTRKAGAKPEEGVIWISSGEGDFTTEQTKVEQRGTSITLHLKEDAKDFAQPWRLRSIITKFSDHIQLPVQMPLEKKEDGDAGGWQTVNKAKALWARAKGEIKDEEYQEFFKSLSHDGSEPLAWAHNRVEGKLEYTSLLYLPKKAPFDLYNREFPRGVKLYVQRVFIMDKAEQLLPLYLRFVKGVVDSNDLPLNVSREILQSDPRLETLRNALTKRVLGMLETMAKEKPQDYQAFWDEFGRVIKEGVAEDMTNRDSLLKLLRFAGTHNSGPEENISLDDYLSRMGEKQDKIYYLVGESHELLKSNPHLEGCKQAGVEVLLLADRIDEWFMTYVHEYEGKGFVDLSREEVDFDKLSNLSKEQKDARKQSEKQLADLPKRMQKSLGEAVKEVRLGHHLVESPACVMQDKGEMGMQMRRIMEAAGQEVPESKPILAINPGHTLIKSLNGEQNENRFTDLARIVLDQALISDGELPGDPAAYVGRVNSLLTQALMR